MIQQPGLAEPFWKCVKKTESCWLWTGYIRRNGYGTLSLRSHPYYAHRVSWELHNGSLDGREIHHRPTCPKHCVNPNHLMAVPRQNNPDSPSHINRLKTHCVRGHPLSDKNLLISRRIRYCKTCQKIFKDKWRGKSQNRRKDVEYARNYRLTHPGYWKTWPSKHR